MVSQPEGVAQFDERAAWKIQLSAIAALFAAGIGLAITSLRLPVLCPLRLMTGVPCPLCGMTTGTVALFRGDLAAAGAANPLSLFFTPGVGVLALDRLRRLTAGRPLLDWGVWSRVSPRAWLFGAGVVLSILWIFELNRFGLL